MPPPIPATGRRRKSPGDRPGAHGPRLEWPGRAWEAGLGATSAHEAPAIQTHEVVPGADLLRASTPAGRIVEGDALDVALALGREGLRGSVDLVYLDPPFASQAVYSSEARLDGPADARVVRTVAFGDRWAASSGSAHPGGGEGVGEYLDMLAPRLDALADLLAPTGDTGRGGVAESAVNDG